MASRTFGPAPGAQQAVLLGVEDAIRAPANIFDSLLQLRMQEQDKARSLLQTLIQNTPGLGRFVAGRPELITSLSKTPSTIKRKGQPGFEEQVTGALEGFGQLDEPLRPADVRQSTNFVQQTFRALTTQGVDMAPFNKAQPKIIRALSLGEPLTPANTGLTEPELATFFNQKEARALGVRESLVELIDPSLKGQARANALLEVERVLSEARTPELVRGLQLEILAGRLEKIGTDLEIAQLKAQLGFEAATEGDPLSVTEEVNTTERLKNNRLIVSSIDAMLALYDKAAAGDPDAARDLGRAGFQIMGVDKQLGQMFGFLRPEDLTTPLRNVLVATRDSLKALIALDEAREKTRRQPPPPEKGAATAKATEAEDLDKQADDLILEMLKELSKGE